MEDQIKNLIDYARAHPIWHTYTCSMLQVVNKAEIRGYIVTNNVSQYKTV